MKTEGYRVDWQTVKGDWPALLLLALTWAGSLWALPRLPDRVPVHWNAVGEVDRWGSPLEGALLLPAIATGAYLLMLLLPAIDPRRANYAYFSGFYRLFRQVLPAFFAFLHGAILASTLGYAVNPTWAVRFAVPVMFLFIGNYLGQVRHNYFVGIRTPWTLASEEVWVRTHRAAARLWVTGSLVMLVVAFLPPVWGLWVMMPVVMIMGLVPVVHSYLIWRRLHS